MLNESWQKKKNYFIENSISVNFTIVYTHFPLFLYRLLLNFENFSLRFHLKIPREQQELPKTWYRSNIDDVIEGSEREKPRVKINTLFATLRIEKHYWRPENTKTFTASGKLNIHFDHKPCFTVRRHKLIRYNFYDRQTSLFDLCDQSLYGSAFESQQRYCLRNGRSQSKRRTCIRRENIVVSPERNVDVRTNKRTLIK